jgi:DNA-binding response OmpR family regulator
MSDVKEPAYRPCVVLARNDATLASDAGRRLRRLGWDVYQAKAGTEARRLARMLDADLVVLDAELEFESGWLTCAKLAHERPGSRIVLLGDASPSNQERARFVGASAIVPCEDSLASLVAQGTSPRAA